MDTYPVDGILFWHRVPAWDGSWGKLLKETKEGGGKEKEAIEINSNP